MSDDDIPRVEPTAKGEKLINLISESLEAIDRPVDADAFEFLLQERQESKVPPVGRFVNEPEKEHDEEGDTTSSVRYKETGERTISNVGNVDEEIASKLYETWWYTAKTALNTSRSNVDDIHLSVVAAICGIITIHMGSSASALAFLYLFIEKLAAYSEEDNTSDG